MQVDPAKISFPQYGLYQICPAEVGPGKVGRVKVGLVQVGTGEDDLRALGVRFYLSPGNRRDARTSQQGYGDYH